MNEDSAEPAGERRTTRAYEQVVSWVEQGVLSGRFHVGDVLPAERDLAAQLQISRSAVREGVRALQAMGVVDSRVGAGSAGGTVITAVPSAALNRFLRMHVALAQFRPSEVVEVRLALETLSVTLAARNAKDSDFDTLDELLAKMADDELTIDEFNDYDTAFHVHIAHVAGNALARDLTVAIRESVRTPIADGMRQLEDWPSLRTRLQHDHTRIAALLRERDVATATVAIQEHIRLAARTVMPD